MPRTIIGVMGPGTAATQEEKNLALELGKLIAEQGWVTLTGGCNLGVMEAASKGARDAGGLTVGILPTPDLSGISEFVDIPIVTDMGSGRNNINVLSSSIVIACGISTGTAAEIALGLRAGKRVILLGAGKSAADFFTTIGPNKLFEATSPREAIEMAKKWLPQ